MTPTPVHTACGIHVFFASVNYKGANAGRTAVDSLAEEALGRGASLIHRDDAPPLPLRDDGTPLSRAISASHCRCLAALAVATEGRAVGVDVETIRPQLQRVAARVFSPAELGRFDSLPELARAWTIKEAAYKAAGLKGVDFRTEIEIDPNLLYVRAREKRLRIVRSEVVYSAGTPVFFALVAD